MIAGGQLVTIAHGDYQAKFVTVGGGMCAVTYRGKYISIPHDPDEVPLAHLGKILLPWPNRLKNSTYEFAGETYSLPSTEKATGNANHGLTAWKEWHIEELDPSRVRLATFVTAVAGYPFTLRAEVVYSLSDEGLDCTISACNVGRRTAPFGAGQHPYISCNLTPLDECTLTFPCTQYFAVDEKLCPTSLQPAAAAGLDFTCERSLKGVKIDHAFVSPAPAAVVLRGGGLEVRMETAAPYLQLFTAEKLQRLGLAVEPMTCPANAFNTKEGLIELAPGESCSLSYRLSARLL